MKVMQQKINKFNRTYKIGDTVRVRFTPTVIESCTLKAPATIVGDKGVVYFKEIELSVSIDRIIY